MWRRIRPERLQLSLSRQHEGFRIVGNMLHTAQLGCITTGFWRWRAAVLDLAAWRLGLARRAAGLPLQLHSSHNSSKGNEDD